MMCLLPTHIHFHQSAIMCLLLTSENSTACSIVKPYINGAGVPIFQILAPVRVTAVSLYPIWHTCTIAKILIRAQFFHPLPLATKYVVALNTLKKKIQV